MRQNVRRLIYVMLIIGLLSVSLMTVMAYEAGENKGQDEPPYTWGEQAPAAVNIAITTTLDTPGDSGTTGCTAGNPCNLRRALVTASNVPVGQRPVSIGFMIPKSDPNYDAATDTWTIKVEDDLPSLSAVSILDPGLTTIDGDFGQGSVGGRTDAPRIIIDTRGTAAVGSYSLIVESDQNKIRNLAFIGGGSLILNGNDNVVENVWVNLSADGQSIVLRDPVSDPADMAGSGGISIGGMANGNIISGTVVAGTKFGRAINVDGDDNLIRNNYVGTRADGTVPVVADNIKCLRSTNYDASNWYGGWGVQIGGSNNQVVNNLIAGLHQTQSANETPPMALEVDGFNHLIQNNTVGVDSAGTEVGVCGIGLNVSGDEIEVLSNEFVDTRKGFEEETSDTAVYVSVSEFSGGEITVRYNIIKDGPSRAIEFTTTTPEELALFQPAQLFINGTMVTGTNGVNSPCPGCDVDLYLDDTDDKEEALAYLGTVTADANGNFVTTLSSELANGFGIRTGSTTNSSGVIGSLGAGASTQLSALYLPAAPPNAIDIIGPTTASVGTAITLTLNVTPDNVTTPLTYLVEATDLAPIEETLDTTSVILTLTWIQPGAKTIEVTASNALGSTTQQYAVEVTADGASIFLPTVLSN